MLNFDKLGAAENVRFQQNDFDIIFFSSSHIFLTLPKNEIKKLKKRHTLIPSIYEFYILTSAHTNIACYTLM